MISGYLSVSARSHWLVWISIIYEYRQERMNNLTKTEIMEKLLKLLQTDRDMDFLLALDEKDLTTLLIALRERMEPLK
jgi:hypothetical protein